MKNMFLNPFIRDKITVKAQAGPRNPITLKMQAYWIDQHKSTRLYFPKGKTIYKLSPQGLLFLVWVMDRLESGKDRVILNPTIYHRAAGASRSSFYNGRKDLIEHGFIHPIKGNEYFINPHFIFAGNRAKWAGDNQAHQVHEPTPRQPKAPTLTDELK